MNIINIMKNNKKAAIYSLVILSILMGLVMNYPIVSICILSALVFYYSYTNDYRSLKFLIILIVLQNIIMIIFSSNLTATDTKLITIMKEVLLYLSIFFTYIVKRKQKIEKIDMLAIAYAIVIIISFFMSDATFTAKIVCIRQLLLPVICIIYGKQININNKSLNKFYEVITYVGIFIAIFGIIELFFLGDNFWKYIGSENYFRNKGIEDWSQNGIMGSFYTYDLSFIVNYPVRRLVSIFGEALSTGHFLFFSLVITFLKYNGKKVIKYILCTILLLSIILTISKGVILLLAIFTVFMMYFYYDKKKLTLIIGIIGVLAISFILIASYGKNTSTGYHIDGLIDNFSNIKILGNGVGKSGNFAKIFGSPSSEVISGESFIGTLLGQIGLVGFVAYILYNLYFVKKIYDSKSIDKDTICITFSLLIGILIEGFLSESAISFLGTSLYFILIGIIYRNKVYVK